MSRKGSIYSEKMEDGSFIDCRKKYRLGYTYNVTYDNGYDKAFVSRKVRVVWIHPKGRFAVAEYDTPLGKVKIAIY